MLFNDSFLDLIDGYYLFSDWIMNHALFWKKQWCWSIHLRDWVGIGGWWVIKTAHQRKATILIITRDEMLVINMFEPPPTATIRKQTLRCGSPPIKFPRACSKKKVPSPSVGHVDWHPRFEGSQYYVSNANCCFTLGSPPTARSAKLPCALRHQVVHIAARRKMRSSISGLGAIVDVLNSPVAGTVPWNVPKCPPTLWLFGVLWSLDVLSSESKIINSQHIPTFYGDLWGLGVFKYPRNHIAGFRNMFQLSVF